jgi:hypothetical protein
VRFNCPPRPGNFRLRSSYGYTYELSKSSRIALEAYSPRSVPVIVVPVKNKLSICEITRRISLGAYAAATGITNVLDALVRWDKVLDAVMPVVNNDKVARCVVLQQKPSYRSGNVGSAVSCRHNTAHLDHEAPGNGMEPSIGRPGPALFDACIITINVAANKQPKAFRISFRNGLRRLVDRP